MPLLLVLLLATNYDSSKLTAPDLFADANKKDVDSISAPVDTKVTQKTWTIPEMQELATEKAQAHGLNVAKFLDVINCESGWDPNIIGDHGTSFGLAQLHYPTKDWGIATTTATDPEVALEIMASAWDRGQASRWSCWKPEAH